MSNSLYTMSDIIKKIVGSIEPVGSETIDMERYNNLEDYCELFYEIYKNLLHVAEYKDDTRYSVKKLGKLADDTIEDLIYTLKKEGYLDEYTY